MCGTPTTEHAHLHARLFLIFANLTPFYSASDCADSLSLALRLYLSLSPSPHLIPSAFSPFLPTHISQQLEPLQFNCYKLTGRTNVSRLLKPRAAFELLLLLLRDRLSRQRYLLSPVFGADVVAATKTADTVPFAIAAFTFASAFITRTALCAHLHPHCLASHP